MSNRLAPLTEEPTINDQNTNTKTKYNNTNNSSSSKRSLILGNSSTWKNWIKSHFFFNKKSDDLKLLLSVLACPLFPLSLHSKVSLDSKVSSHAQYIIQHFTAATGCRKLEGKIKSIFATGKVTMATADHEQLSPGFDGSSSVAQKGCFVVWQMDQNKWLIELVVAGHKVIAGSDGNMAWRHTPWLGAHAAKGGVRPLRRALQGLDPLAISSVFSPAQYIGEKCIYGEDCFVLKLSADQADLADRSDSTAEMIKHVVFGYFSQRNGLLVHLEDSYLTRIQTPGNHPTYWETTMTTTIEDYKPVEGLMIAHAGRSNVTITRFGDNLKAGLSITGLEETWTIDDVAFNVPGLSLDCFIPPKEIRKEFSCDDFQWRSPVIA